MGHRMALGIERGGAGVRTGLRSWFCLRLGVLE